MKQCPACNYELTFDEQAKSDGKCPQCDVYFAKYLARQSQAEAAAKAKASKEPAETEEKTEKPSAL